MNRIDQVFAKCRAEKRPALIMYVTSGFPNEAATRAILPALVEGGCDLIELGVPFSDPLADGPTIQKASADALAAGMTFEKTLNIVRDFRKSHQTPIVLFGAYNPFLHRGLEKSAQDAAAAGADGFLAADLPTEECDPFRNALAAKDLKLVLLAAPTSPDERLASIGAQSGGFVYCISLKGITGARQQISDTVVPYLKRVRTNTKLPIAVGFGISTPEHVAAIAPHADGIVVGSALVSTIRAAHESEQDVASAARTYVRSLAEGLQALA